MRDAIFLWLSVGFILGQKLASQLVGRVERSETRHPSPSIVAEHKNLHRGLDLKQQATIALYRYRRTCSFYNVPFTKTSGFATSLYPTYLAELY